MSPRGQAGLLLLILATLEFTSKAGVLSGTLALFQRDLLFIYFPLVQATLRELSQGALPLRDPTTAFGQPLLANPDAQILYLPSWLQIFLPSALAYAWFVSLHSVFGALGVALLARRLSGGSFAAALTASLAWLISGPLLSLASLWHHMSGASWIPWVWLALERVLARERGRPGLVFGAVVGAQILAGSAEMCASTLLIAAMRVIAAREWGLWRTWVTSGATAILLGAGVWLPVGELIMNTGRAAILESTRTYWSMHPFNLFEFFLPIPLGALPFNEVWRGGLFEGREPFLASMFFGAPILPLLMAAFADSAFARSIRVPGFLGMMGGVLTALGKHAVFYGILVTALPLLKVFRYPSKAMVPVTVLICVFAGLGVVSLRRSSRSRLAAVVGIAVLCVVGLALAGPLMEPIQRETMDNVDSARVASQLRADFLGSLIILAVLLGFMAVKSSRISMVLLALVGVLQIRQTLVMQSGLSPTVPSAVVSYRPELLEIMRPPAGGRIYVYDYWSFRGKANRFVPQNAPMDWEAVKALEHGAAHLVTTRHYLAPLTGAFWGVEYAWDSDLRMLFDRRLRALTLGIRGAEETPGFLKLLQISGVHRVVSMHAQGMEALKLLAIKDFRPRPIHIFEVPDPLPRAYVVSGRKVGTGRDLRELTDYRFDPRTTVLVDRGPARAPVDAFTGEAKITEERADRIRVETRSSHPGFLTVLAGTMPGWRVWVDGRPAGLERANAIFIGTEVPAGDHVVEFRFLPVGAVVGVSATLLTALFLLSAFVTGVRFR
ncbi:MAG: YfhO family protein [Vicinamibacteria bacterium]|jgi:hypothetical protein|nr:YfhO family protein [Vicinamibacteria bacterium]